jgi:hypothetical protein
MVAGKIKTMLPKPSALSTPIFEMKRKSLQFPLKKGASIQIHMQQ